MQANANISTGFGTAINTLGLGNIPLLDLNISCSRKETQTVLYVLQMVFDYKNTTLSMDQKAANKEAPSSVT